MERICFPSAVAAKQILFVTRNCRKFKPEFVVKEKSSLCIVVPPRLSFFPLFLRSCVFLPNNGAFFVNYLITSALIGTALELCRFPELVSYAGNMACARNDGEKRLIRKVRRLFNIALENVRGWFADFFQCKTDFSVSE